MDFKQLTIQGVDGKGGLNLWEGRTAFLYLDNRKVNGFPSPLVTVGVGCAVPIAEAFLLPFEVDGRPATRAEIMADYMAVKSAPFGFAAGHYEKLTKCRLPDAAIDALVDKRFATFLDALHSEFPEFDSYPDQAKAGCLDLIYGLGVAGLEAPHYPSFRAAVKARNWKEAAKQCGADEHLSAYDDRNQARRLLFLAAAGQ